MVDTFGVFSDKAATEFADDFEDFVKIIHCVLIVLRSIVKLFCVCIVAFFESNYFLHQRMSQMMLKVGVVSIEVCHYFEFFL